MRRRSSPSVRIFYPKYNKEGLIQSIRQRLSVLEAKLPLMRVILFGSYARGNYTVASDVDILIVYRGEINKDAYATVKKILDIPGLEPHLYCEKRYLELKKTIQKMVADGIVIY